MLQVFHIVHCQFNLVKRNSSRAFHVVLPRYGVCFILLCYPSDFFQIKIEHLLPRIPSKPASAPGFPMMLDLGICPVAL